MDTLLQHVNKHKLAIVIAIAILARLVILLVGRDIFFYEQTGQIHGSHAYDEYALNLLETGVYGREVGVPDANIPPLYSYVVAGVYALFGRGGLQIGVFHTVLDVISIVLVYQICVRLFFQPDNNTNAMNFSSPLVAEGDRRRRIKAEWVGALTGLFYALYPYLIFQTLSLNDTALFMMLMHAFIVLLIIIREREQLDRRTFLLAILAGIVLGVTTLNRALLPLFALFAALWFLFKRSVWQTFLRLLPVAIVSFLVLVPWMIRSYGIYDNFVAVALNTGENLYQGANEMTMPLFEAGYDVQWSDPPPNVIEGDYFANNHIMTDAALTWYEENLSRLPELLWLKFRVHWSINITPTKNPLPGQSFAVGEDGNLLVLDDPDADKQDIDTIALYTDSFFDRVGRPVHMLYFGTLLLLALSGQILAWQQWRYVSLLVFLQLSMTIMYMLFHPSTRYRVPTDPLLFAFAAYGVVVIINRLLRRRQQSTQLIR